MVGIRASFPEEKGYDWFNFLKSLETIECIEVAFYRPEVFRKISIDKVIHPFEHLKIKVSSVHMAHERITKPNEFFETLTKTVAIAKRLRCENIVIHPSNAKLEDIKGFIEQKINPLLEKEEIYICWETFAGKRRFLSGIEEIVEFCKGQTRYFACYDFSHLLKPQESVISEIREYLNFIRIFHLSNWSEQRQHLPVFTEEGSLDFKIILRVLKQEEFKGDLILEYLPEFHRKLIKDCLKVKKMLENSYAIEIVPK